MYTMSLDPIDQARFIGKMNGFFAVASRGKPNTLETLHEKFDKIMDFARDEAETLLRQVQDPHTLPRDLKIAADDAHPGFTRSMSAIDIFGYTMNTFADGCRITLQKRYPVQLPTHMAGHADSLFEHERKKATAMHYAPSVTADQ